jgi:large subunit ribosomal protein L27
MAHKKAGGSTSLGRESQSKRLGIKLFAGEVAKAGSIIVRQRGSKFRVGLNVKRGGDDTLYSMATGVIKFTRKKVKKYDGRQAWVTVVNVVEAK